MSIPDDTASYTANKRTAELTSCFCSIPWRYCNH